MFSHIKIDGPGDLAAETMFNHRLIGGDPGCACFQGCHDLFGIVANGRDDPQTCNDDSAHVAPLS